MQFGRWESAEGWLPNDMDVVNTLELRIYSYGNGKTSNSMFKL